MHTRTITDRKGEDRGGGGGEEDEEEEQEVQESEEEQVKGGDTDMQLNRKGERSSSNCISEEGEGDRQKEEGAQQQELISLCQ